MRMIESTGYYNEKIFKVVLTIFNHEKLSDLSDNLFQSLSKKRDSRVYLTFMDDENEEFFPLREEGIHFDLDSIYLKNDLDWMIREIMLDCYPYIKDLNDDYLIHPDESGDDREKFDFDGLEIESSRFIYDDLESDD